MGSGWFYKIIGVKYPDDFWISIEAYLLLGYHIFRYLLLVGYFLFSTYLVVLYFLGKMCICQ